MKREGKGGRNLTGWDRSENTYRRDEGMRETVRGCTELNGKERTGGNETDVKRCNEVG